MTRSETLADALPKEIERVQTIIPFYRDPELNGAGEIAAQMMELDIRIAHGAMMSGDVVGMLQAYERLKGWDDV
ncbi:MAG: hypothetical protein IPH49_15915 [Ignavibacteria bacterium]|nr:hypothetical protein [Ignavibacteria bacterium]